MILRFIFSNQSSAYLTSPLLATLHNVVRMTHPSVEAFSVAKEKINLSPFSCPLFPVPVSS